MHGSIATGGGQTKALTILRLEAGRQHLFKQTNINIMHNGIVKRQVMMTQENQ